MFWLAQCWRPQRLKFRVLLASLSIRWDFRSAFVHPLAIGKIGTGRIALSSWSEYCQTGRIDFVSSPSGPHS